MTSLKLLTSCRINAPPVNCAVPRMFAAPSRVSWSVPIAPKRRPESSGGINRRPVYIPVLNTDMRFSACRHFILLWDR